MAAGLGRGATRVCVLCVNALYDRAGAPAAARRVRPAARGAVVARKNLADLARAGASAGDPMTDDREIRAQESLDLTEIYKMFYGIRS